MRNSVTIAAFLAATGLSTAAAARDDAQLWTAGTVNVKLSDKWRLSQEVVARFSDRRNGLYEIESNTMLGYQVGKKVTLWAGYTHDPQYAGGDFTVMEHRVRTQVTVDNIAKIGGGNLSARMRLETRWREGVDGTAWRLRPFVRYSLPLKKGGPTLNLSHESFVDLNKTAFQRVGGEERMRNLIAISFPIAKRINAEVGYLHQHGFVPNGDDSNDHVASFALSASF